MKSKSSLMALAGSVLLVLSTPASAATTIAGAVSNISYLNADPGLVVYANPLAFADIVLNNVGDSAFRWVMNIGTTEEAVNIEDDYVPYPISVTFSFSQPAGTSGLPITGTTGGFIDWGYVDFSSTPTVFNFGNGGSFSVELFDNAFGTPGNTDIKAKFKLLSESTGGGSVPTGGVPEPSTWAMMILGFGAIGLMMRRKRSSPPARLLHGFKGLPQLA